MLKGGSRILCDTDTNAKDSGVQLACRCPCPTSPICEHTHRAVLPKMRAQFIPSAATYEYVVPACGMHPLYPLPSVMVGPGD